MDSQKAFAKNGIPAKQSMMQASHKHPEAAKALLMAVKEAEIPANTAKSV